LPLILDCRTTAIDVNNNYFELASSNNSLYSMPEKGVTLALKKRKPPAWTSPTQQKSFDLNLNLARFKDYTTKSLENWEAV